jgi:hypothetical protein
VSLPTTLAYETVKTSVLGGAKKISEFIEGYVNLNKIIVITAVVLACLATLASVVYGSMMSLSLSATLLAASCLCYKINQELFEKSQECKRLQDHIIDKERLVAEHLEDHEKMSSSITRLETVSGEQEIINKDLTHRLEKALELVEFCDTIVGKATQFSEKSEAISAELIGYKGVLDTWLQDMRRMFDKESSAQSASEKVVRLLEDFSKGQHTELARMLEQLQSVQQQIAASSAVVTEQQETLRMISSDIMQRTLELREIHTQLASLHKEAVTTRPRHFEAIHIAQEV